MAQMMPPNPNDVMNMRKQGLTDGVIGNEFAKKGYSADQVNAALRPQGPPPGMPPMGRAHMGSPVPSPSGGNDRMEEIVETMIDEKWDELLGEVRKVLEWKSKVEKVQTRMETQLKKLEDDFKTLHQGVLGRLEDYDTRMKDVGTELKAVGKVFKDVIPTFVENVKELRHVVKNNKKE